MKRASGPVPERQGKHPMKRFDRGVQSSPFDRGKHDLGIRVALKTGPMRFLRPSEVLEVVDLTVENDNVPATGRDHRLMTFRRQVENGQPAESETEATVPVPPITFIVGAAMPDRVRHAAQDSRRVVNRISTPESAQAAHGRLGSSDGGTGQR